jgi:hypothetical protein
MRERYGEKLTDNSILIREQFDIRDTHQIRKARQLSRDAIRWMTLDIAKRCAVRSTEFLLLTVSVNFYKSTYSK